MTIESDLRTFLAADGTISGLVSSRVYGIGYKPQNSSLPALTFSRESTDWINELEAGQSGYVGAEFQIDAWADNYDDVNSLREAVLSRVQNYNGLMGSTAVDWVLVNSGPVDVYEDSLEQYRSSVGIIVWYNS